MSRQLELKIRNDEENENHSNNMKVEIIDGDGNITHEKLNVGTPEEEEKSKNGRYFKKTPKSTRH